MICEYPAPLHAKLPLLLAMHSYPSAFALPSTLLFFIFRFLNCFATLFIQVTHPLFSALLVFPAALAQSSIFTWYSTHSQSFPRFCRHSFPRPAVSHWVCTNCFELIGKAISLRLLACVWVWVCLWLLLSVAKTTLAEGQRRRNYLVVCRRTSNGPNYMCFGSLFARNFSEWIHFEFYSCWAN